MGKPGPYRGAVQKLNIALMGSAARMVSSAASIPGNRNMHIRSCVKSPLKNLKSPLKELSI